MKKVDLVLRDLSMDEVRELLARIDNFVPSVVGQQTIVDEGGDVELATSKQKSLMDKHGIVYDESTSKIEASDRISSFFESKKQGKKGD